MQLCPRAIVRAGTIVDGSGAAAFTGDVAIDNGCIVAVGGVDGPAYRTLEADGLLVTPGFVDIHTHYDGQATWDPLLTPSCWHGVTTAVMGNCGVGFAPMQPGRREFLALIAGALGFSMSRTLLHKTARSEYVPNFGAAATELNAIAAGVRRARRGVLQLLSDFGDVDGEFEMLCDWVRASDDRPLSFTLVQRLEMPQQWRRLLELKGSPRITTP